MGSILVSRFSLDRYKTILIIFQIVCYRSCGSIVLPTPVYPHDDMQNDSDLVSFDIFAPIPSFPAGGDFGNGAIDLGGLKVYKALYFKKVWETFSGGPEDSGASFYEPASIPEGFSLIGHLCKPHYTSLIFSTVLTAKDTSQGALKPPIDYTLIWTSKGFTVSELEDGYIWLPIPPDGYKVLGHIVTTSPEKPPLDKVRCVRSDFTDSTDVDKWIWGDKMLQNESLVNLFTTKPKSRDRSVPNGMFLARNNSDTRDLTCFKMVKTDAYTAMPNSLQVKKLLSSYAPWVYFHPEEKFLPSSVLWFFQNGAEQHQMGRAPEPVMNDGVNLPNDGSSDAFLDLPSDKADKERVKKGSLADVVCYIHVKPTFGGTHTDLVLWLYYPFNGGGMFQLGPFSIDLGKIGEHVSDWEHITLRIDNFHGILNRVYLSQHARGKWFRPQEFEFMNNTRPVVYAALHSHSHYATAISHIHLFGKVDPNDVRMLYHEFRMNNSRKSPIIIADKVFGFGIRDDAAKSNNVMDIASTYNVVFVDYNKDFSIKPWLNYTGRWGPKISYGFTKEVLKITKTLPDKVKELANKLLYKLPAELLGEEGPPGPKMKDSWYGDEKVW